MGTREEKPMDPKGNRWTSVKGSRDKGVWDSHSNKHRKLGGICLVSGEGGVWGNQKRFIGHTVAKMGGGRTPGECAVT